MYKKEYIVLIICLMFGGCATFSQHKDVKKLAENQQTILDNQYRLTERQDIIINTLEFQGMLIIIKEASFEGNLLE